MAGIGCVAIIGIGAVTVAASDGRGEDKVRATLRDAAGTVHGTVTFKYDDDHTEVRVRLDSVPAPLTGDTFHGFHVHANGDLANGVGCVPDPTGAANLHFVSADGHWKNEGESHGAHRGDMPSLLLAKDGSAEQRFLTDRVSPGELRGKAVILHAGADNFGNIPVGPPANLNQYTANGPAATTATANTGNAGNRVLCGVIG